MDTGLAAAAPLPLPGYRKHPRPTIHAQLLRGPPPHSVDPVAPPAGRQASREEDGGSWGVSPSARRHASVPSGPSTLHRTQLVLGNWKRTKTPKNSDSGMHLTGGGEAWRQSSEDGELTESEAVGRARARGLEQDAHALCHPSSARTHMSVDLRHSLMFWGSVGAAECWVW